MESRDYGVELDLLHTQMNELQQLFKSFMNEGSHHRTAQHETEAVRKVAADNQEDEGDTGVIFYSGHYHENEMQYRWEPQERKVSQLLELDGDKTAKILAALGHKQRLDILRSVLKEPLTGTELVERLNMGTTGQLYHHIKALLGADLLIQEERGGKYSLAGRRALPVLLLLAAASDLLDTSDYLDLAEARSNAGAYLGNSSDEYNPHLLLQSVLENTILEHQAGYCSVVSIFLHGDGSITVADNGRGIPIQALPNSEKPRVQAVLTEIGRYGNGSSASIIAPGSEKGINIPIVNALSLRLTVEIRRDGRVFRQDYKHGIPQSELLTVGVTHETGTSITFRPDHDIFRTPFDRSVIANQISKITAAYPSLSIQFDSV